ncbi:MAG: hypothetical protein Q8K21_10895 [Hydrogenophaga sp.]|uniref:hypothetical protein n=1 Tax=Hydrogenophaga sp. TaxID=1904254 RepID=UPI00272FB09D|nr:hypothetical protein [Hydrogenophaga sp.]MDP2164704.1 hypothetical protein [Hydrogenophaga sp.]
MKQVYEFLESFVVIALVLAGISGISYNLFRADGWLETVIGNIWSLGTQYIVIAVPVLVGAIVLFDLWRSGRVIHSKTSILPNLLLYSLIGAGVYYIGRYVVTGTI